LNSKLTDSGLSVKLMDRTLLVAVSVTCLFINFIGYDIFNTSRFASLIFFASICLSILVLNFNKNVFFDDKLVLYLSLLFAISIALSLINSKGKLLEGLIGVYGRNIGALTLFSFIVFFLSSYFSNSIFNCKNLLFVIIGIGLISAFYGLIQIINLDPLLTTNLYNPVRGFFGNPNFHSAFLGISSIATFATVISKEFSYRIRLFLSLCLILFIVVILATDSKQGIILFVFGAAIILTIRFWLSNKLKVLGKFLILIIPLSALVVVLDLLRIAPWRPLIYEASVSYRGDYWRAGIAMFFDNPFFGVGPDGYRDQFRFYRDEINVNRIGVDPPINSAHNIFIELAASGGLPLLLTYILMLALIPLSIAKLIKSLEQYDYSVAGVIGCWVGFFVQSLISVNTIPISLIGWILMGKLLGIRRNRELSMITRKKNNFFLKLSLLPFISIFLIGLPMILNDINYKKALESQRIDEIKAAAYGFPKDVYRMSLIAEIFRRANMPDVGIKIARDAVKLNPNNFEALEELYLMPNISTQEKDIILNRLKYLDPLNKKILVNMSQD